MYHLGISRISAGALIFTFSILLLSSLAEAQTAVIGGNIYSGANDGTGPVLAPNPATPPINDARVMVQTQGSGGKFITYGTVSGNSWTATVPAPGDYVVMISAPGHDLTSREFTVQDGGNQSKDAYLPPLFKNPDGTASANELPTAGILMFAFWDAIVNGEPDVGDGDLPLNGVTWTISDEEGNVLDSCVTGSQPIINTLDGLVITNTDGLCYITGLPPGEVIATSDPSGIAAATQVPELPQKVQFDASTEWILNFTEEGGPAWDPKLYPGDPGTEAGSFLIWHSYVKKMGPITSANVADPERFGPGATLAGAGSIHGFLEDADKTGLDPDEPFPVPGEDHPGVTLNEVVPDGVVILFTDAETGAPHPVATTEADPVTGEFRFDNVPPGAYKIMNFDLPLDYVYTENQIRIQPNQAVEMPPHSILVPRFFARATGHVYDVSTCTGTDPVTNIPSGCTGMPGQEVHLRFKSGDIKMERITTATPTTDQTGTAHSPGWYKFDDLPEIEVTGNVDVKLPPGFRGAVFTENFFPKGKPGHTLQNPDGSFQPAVVVPVEHNSKNRYIQWLTANYQADLYIEPIPLGKGHIDGYVFNDNFKRGDWEADGVYDPDEERTLHGVTVELWNASMTTLIATTTTGKLDKNATVPQGFHLPATLPPDELGGVYVGPEIGYYEFRDVDPGNYIVKVIPPEGFSPSPVGSTGEEVVTVTGTEPSVPTNGDRHEIDFGMNTRPNPLLAFGVPLAGEIEGGVFDDVNIDTRWNPIEDPINLGHFLGFNAPTSLLAFEKGGVTGAPVGVYDHLGYFLGSGNMGNPVCFAGAPAGNCPPTEVQVQKPEMERRFAPGVHIYVGNDPTLPGHNPGFLPLTLPYTFGQGKFKFEADWSLIPTIAPMANGVVQPGQILPNNAPVINPPGGLAFNLPQGYHLMTASFPGSPLTSGGSFSVSPGDILTVTGQNFGDRRGYGTASLSGRKLPVKKWRDTEIRVKIPNNAVSGPLLVANSTGISNTVWVDVAYPSYRAAYMAARTVYVDAANTGTEDGSALHPWSTISEALNHLPAAAPRYVFVAPGTYVEQVRIPVSNVYIIGSGPLETAVLGPSSVEIPGVSGFDGSGPVFKVGVDDLNGDVSNILISGMTIAYGSVKEETGAGIYGGLHITHLDINNNMIIWNGGCYGGGISLHKTTHNLDIWSNVVAENGNACGFGGGISVDDEPEDPNLPDPGQPEHVVDDFNMSPPPGIINIFNNLVFHNWSADSGGAITLYETKDGLNVYGNMIVENKAEDHGGAMFFEDSGPINLYGNVFLRNFCYDDGGAVSFEDVGDLLSMVWVYNNLFAQNIADDHGENHARGGALAFDDTFQGYVYNNTLVGNIVAGSEDPAGGAIDSERNGHEYNGTDGPLIFPGYSDPMIYNNVIWNNWKLAYNQPNEGKEEDLDYTFGENYQWTPDELHVDNPEVQGEWETAKNSLSFSFVFQNDIQGGYNAYGYEGANLDTNPLFFDPQALDWHLQSGSPVINGADSWSAPKKDLDNLKRHSRDYMVDMGAYEFHWNQPDLIRIPEGILGNVPIPTPGSTSLN